MTQRRPSPLPTRFLLSIAAAVLVGLGLGGPANASAGVGAHGGHRCPCGMDCGSKCCCGPKHASADRAKPSRPPATSDPVARPAGPCLAAAPCGGALPGGTNLALRVIDPADRAALPGLAPVLSFSMMPPPGSDRVEPGPGSRVEEPPEPIDA